MCVLLRISNIKNGEKLAIIQKLEKKETSGLPRNWTQHKKKVSKNLDKREALRSSSDFRRGIFSLFGTTQISLSENQIIISSQKK